MNPQALSNLNKNIIYTRSNSIRKGGQRSTPSTHLQPINLSLKLNEKQFPVDFFKRSHKNGLKNKENYTNVKTRKITSVETDHQVEGVEIANCCSENNQGNQQFQITSFFQCGGESVETIDSGDTKQNQPNLQTSQFSSEHFPKVSNSLQLPTQNSTELLCTFSKLPLSISKQTTPEKKFKDIQLPMSNNSDECPLRPSSKTEHRQNIIDFGKIQKLKSRRSSMERNIATHRSQVEYCWEKKVRGAKGGEFVGLPPIYKRK